MSTINRRLNSCLLLIESKGDLVLTTAEHHAQLMTFFKWRGRCRVIRRKVLR